MPIGSVARYLDYDKAESSRQQALADAGLQEIAPVILPEPGTLGGALLEEGLDRHFGWPVAAMSGGTVVVAFNYRGRGHCVVRSADGCKTWSPPVAMKDVAKHPGAQGPGMCAVGSTRDGGFVLSCALGVFVSKDAGDSWEHLDCRLGGDGPLGNSGPRILDHPRFGWVLPYHRKGTADAPMGLCFFASRDKGRTWEHAGPVSGKGFSPAEPTAFALGDAFAVFSRNHSGYPAENGGYHRHWSYFAQFVPKNAGSSQSIGDLEFDGRLTNIYVRRMDTPDALFNPVSGRIEAVVPKRNEGFPYPDNAFRTVSLWSIEPEAFLRGEARWRFECVLLRSSNVFSGTPGSERPPREGFHPAGTVLDLERGVQHVFVYSGNCSHIYGHGMVPQPRNPKESATGVFRITRTLDTARLRAAAMERDRLAGAFAIQEDFADLGAWTPGGSPVGLRLTDNKDIVERTVAPLPGPAPECGPDGLRWELSAPGYSGLHHEGVAATDRCRLSFKAKVERFPAGGDALGVCVCRGAIKHYLILREDGLYQWTDPNRPPELARRLDMDGEWHEWALEVDGHGAEALRDGEPVAEIACMVEGLPGRDDAPASLFVRPAETSSPAAVRVAWIRLDNEGGVPGNP